MTQLEWQIKTLIWLLGMTVVKQTFSLSSRGRLADPKTLILFISFFSDSESESKAFTNVVLAFNPHADVKACSSRDAFTWRQEEENKVLYSGNGWDCPAAHFCVWAGVTELILLRSRVILIWQREKWSALILDCDCGSSLWFCPCWAERTMVQAGFHSILNSSVPLHKLRLCLPCFPGRVGTPPVTGVPVKHDVEKLLSNGLMGFCLYGQLMLVLTKAKRTDWWQIRTQKEKFDQKKEVKPGNNMLLDEAMARGFCQLFFSPLQKKYSFSCSWKKLHLSGMLIKKVVTCTWQVLFLEDLFFLIANINISGPTATPVKNSPQQC